jgi:hypothetical protein
MQIDFASLPEEVQSIIASKLDLQTLDSFRLAGKVTRDAAENFKHSTCNQMQDIIEFVKLPLTDILRYEWTSRTLYEQISGNFKKIRDMNYHTFIHVIPYIVKNKRLMDYIIMQLSSEGSGSIEKWFEDALKVAALKNNRLFVTNS